MWKLMIADDEPKIRRGLRTQIMHMGLDIEIVSEAEDGEHALEQVNLTQPDILLVDINMPFLSGLDFIEQLKKNRRDAVIIVITGFEAFEYAHRALDLGVFAYLLKPVELSSLRATLDGAIQKLMSERMRERHYAWALSQIEKRRDSLWEEFLSDLIRGGLTRDEIADQAALLKIPAMRRTVLMMIKALPDAGQPWRPRILQYAFADALRDALSGCRFSCVFSDERDHVMMLYDADEALDERLLQAAKQAGAALLVSASIQVAQAGGLDQLEETYDNLLSAMRQAVSRPAAVDQAAAYIQRNFSRSDLSLTDVAEAVGVNPSYLSRLMKQELGMPFSKYLTNVRLNAAVQMMNRGEARIRQIGERVGYATPHYFSTAFKKVLGTSPAEYRSEDKTR
jgi:two-component system response regulator YesN